jgi:hypothetical protein
MMMIIINEEQFEINCRTPNETDCAGG